MAFHRSDTAPSSLDAAVVAGDRIAAASDEDEGGDPWPGAALVDMAAEACSHA